MHNLIRLRRKEVRDNRSDPEVSPEEVFLSWLMTLPFDADIAQAARLEIARLDRAEPLPPGPARLRDLMRQATLSPHQAALLTQ